MSRTVALRVLVVAGVLVIPGLFMLTRAEVAGLAAVWIAASAAVATTAALVFAVVERSVKRTFADQSDRLAEANRRLKIQLKQLTFLNRLGQDLSRTLDLEQTMQRLASYVIESLEVDELAVLLFDRERRKVFLLAAQGFEDDGVVEVPFEADRGITGEAVRRKQSIYVPDLTSDPREVVYRSGDEPRGSLLSVPMLYQQEVVGVLNFSAAQSDAFDESHRALFETVASQAALALTNARLYLETLELTETDGLTSLLNRRGLDKRVSLEWARAQRDSLPLSAIMIDIDHFKTYNDQQGHQMGDETIRKVARLISQKVRSVDAVARYGGEEFLVILPRADKAAAVEVARKLRRTIEGADFERGYLQPLGRITISCGVATAPADARDADDLIRAADAALYEAKAGGRNQVRAA